MKGVILAGGDGTRLYPLTYAVNKHLLRIGKAPMIEYPLRKMIEAGIKDIHVVTGGENYQGVVKYLGSGSRWNVRITYSIQDKAGGIAEALGLAKAFVGQDKMLVLLGDNVFDMNLTSSVNYFDDESAGGEALLFSHYSFAPNRFGVLKFKGDRVIDVIEKPEKFMGNLVLAGIYMFTPDVFDVIKCLIPSKRGELEISDVNRHYIMIENFRVVPLKGSWTDCGTFETLMDAEQQVRLENEQC